MFYKVIYNTHREVEISRINLPKIGVFKLISLFKDTYVEISGLLFKTPTKSCFRKIE